MSEISEYRQQLAATVKANVRDEFGPSLLKFFSESVAIAIVDAHVLRVVAAQESEITAEKIRTLRNDSRSVVLFDL